MKEIFIMLRTSPRKRHLFLRIAGGQAILPHNRPQYKWAGLVNWQNNCISCYYCGDFNNYVIITVGLAGRAGTIFANDIVAAVIFENLLPNRVSPHHFKLLYLLSADNTIAHSHPPPRCGQPG